jgi:hypothetical protein
MRREFLQNLIIGALTLLGIRRKPLATDASLASGASYTYELCLHALRDRPEETLAGLEAYFPIRLVMSCGYEFHAQHPAEVPLVSVSCPCGDPMHTLVHWEWSTLVQQ